MMSTYHSQVQKLSSYASLCFSCRGFVCGEFLNWSYTSQDVYSFSTANFSTSVQKSYTGGNYGSSTVGQKAYAGGNTTSTVGQKAYAGGNTTSTVGQRAFTGDRVYAAYMVYKSKAALEAEPVAPTFGKTENGSLFIKRSGYIMLSFSPSRGERKYDWEQKQKFALSPVEVGSLITMGPGGSCEFFHDPGLKKSNAGQVRKTLQIRSNETGFFISLTVNDKVKNIENQRFLVPVTSAEFAVMRTSFSFALPHIMGWDRYTYQSPGENKATELPRMMGGDRYPSQSPRENKATAVPHMMGGDRYPSQSPVSKEENKTKSGGQLLDSEWDR